MLISLIRLENDKKLMVKTEDENELKQHILVLKVFEKLFDIAHKDIKPIDLIKEAGPEFIIK